MRVLYCCYRLLHLDGKTYSSSGSFPYLMPELARHTAGLYLLAPVVSDRIEASTPFDFSERLLIVPIRGCRNRWLHLLSAESWSLRALRQFLHVLPRVSTVVMAIPSGTYYAAFLPFVDKPIVVIVAGDEQDLMRRSSHPFMYLARIIGLHRFKDMCERRILERASAIVCRSEKLAMKCRQAPDKLTPIHIIASGIDTNRFRLCTCEEKIQSRHKLGVDVATSVIGCVATALTSGKGAYVLREAFSRIRQVLAGVDLLLIGEDRGVFCAEGGVIRCGWIPSSDLPSYYAAMDVFVCSSLSEGAPKVVMEACACGLPVVASRVGAISEWFSDGRCGIAVDIGDADAMADACLHLLSDPDLRARVGANARELAVSQFDYRICAAQLAEVLRSVSSGGPQ